MKKYKSIILISVFSLIVSSLVLIAENTKVPQRNLGGKVRIFKYFKIKIIDDGKLSQDKMLVELRIYNHGDKIYVTWDHVYISPQDDLKKVILKAQHYSVQEGTITDVIATQNHFSFKIDVSTSLFAGRTVQVVGNKEEGAFKYSVEGSALWWSDILNRKIKTEWRSTNRKFILPYKEVF